MAEKMDIIKVFGILLNGGYIASTEFVQRKTKYHVFSAGNNLIGQYTGHITQKQFENMCAEGIVESNREQRTDKYGNIITFYYLAEKNKRGV